MGSASSSHPQAHVDPSLAQPHLGIKGTILEGVCLPPEEPYLTVEEIAAAKRLQIGDPIEFEDKVLRHWALYAGEQEAEKQEDGPIPMVVHFFSMNGAPHEVRYDTLKTASDGKRCRVNKKYDAILEPRSADEIMRKAHSMIGKKDYDIISNNCEHFMTGCRYGFFVSEQVQEAQGNLSKQFEIARHAVSSGFNTATYSFKGLFSSKK